MSTSTATENETTGMRVLYLSDESPVATTAASLEVLYNEFPSLQYILEGHPDMQQQNNSQTLRIHQDFGICQNDWVLLSNFCSPERVEPQSKSDWARLQAVAAILGGSPTINAAYNRASYNPMSPLEDTAERYLWATVWTGEMTPPDRSANLDRCVKHGLKLVSEEPYEIDGRTYYKRQYRGPRTVSS